ncbi:ParB N-terminal domain-containing protein [Grimontia indica]|nr:ParB N-terminal domain-containing protein [Grimontia indica]
MKKTEMIRLEDLVPHESSATQERIKKIGVKWSEPIVVKPIPNTNKYAIYQGHNRAKIAQQSGVSDIEAIVGTPDHLRRNIDIYSMRIKKNPQSPLSGLAISADDLGRKNLFYQEADNFSKAPILNTHRGTIIKVDIYVKFDDEIKVFKSLPQKGGFGGLIFDPTIINAIFQTEYVNQSKVAEVWGDESILDDRVLPAYIELGKNGDECRGGGFAYDVSFRVEEGDNFVCPKVTARPTVVDVHTHVIYPDGNYWTGSVFNEIENTSAIIWSDKLAKGFLDKDKANEFFGKDWWNTPSSLLFSRNGMKSGCLHVHHSCGSTCHGGGCLV